jgi:ABC-type branched-subunit amino acid transport system substrate-binding protein/outer membrane protein assembly factor BamD (BamD/ComL family)
MTRSIIGSIFIALICLSTVLGQSLEENKRKYNNGKELFKQGKYDLALQEFRQVAAPRPNNPYNRFASYFYIASAAKLNKFTDAKLMAAQIENKYPDWNKLPEVRYVLAEMAFKERNYSDALAFLDKIAKGIDPKEIKGMAFHYLGKISSIDSLREIQKKNPDDPYVGEVLANRIQMSNAAAEDEELLNKLVKKFKLDTAAFSSSLKFQSKKKNVYNVALILPFNLYELSADQTNRANFYALDLYEGIKLGVENLAKKGIKINLFTYDAGKDNNAIQAVIAKPSLKTMDLIIGPLTNTPIPAFDNFLLSNKVLAVNPVGTSSTLVASDPFVFLSQPTLEQQSKKAAEFILQNFAPKKAAVYFGATPKDSILCAAYHQQLVQKGVKILAYKKVTKANVSVLSKVLSDSLQRDLGNVFVSSSEQSVAANIVSELEKSGYRNSIVTLPQWMQYSFFNIDQFSRMNFYFIYPDFVDYNSESVKEFRDNYKKSVNIIPSDFSFSGYDLINYFGNGLAKFGTNFQKGIASAGFTPGITVTGYDYSQGNWNSFVPLVKFEEGDLKVINAPIK